MKILGKILKWILVTVGLVVVLNIAAGAAIAMIMRQIEPANIVCFGCSGKAEKVNVYFGGYSDQATFHAQPLVEKMSGANVFVDYNRWGYDPQAIADAVYRFLQSQQLLDSEIRSVGFSLGMKPATLLADRLSDRKVTLIGINPCYGGDAVRTDAGVNSAIAKNADNRLVINAIKWVAGVFRFYTVEMTSEQYRGYSLATIAEQGNSLASSTLPSEKVKTLILTAGKDDLIDNAKTRTAYPEATIVEIPGMTHTQVSWQPEKYIEALQRLGIE